MAQRKLLVIALVLALGFGRWIFGPSVVYGATPSPSSTKSPTPTASVSVSPSPTATVSPSSSVTPTPVASFSPVPTDNPIRVWQIAWKKLEKTTNVVSVQGKKTKKSNNNSSSSSNGAKVGGAVGGVVGAAAGTAAGVGAGTAIGNSFSTVVIGANPILLPAVILGSIIGGSLIGSLFGGDEKPQHLIQDCIKQEYKAGYHAKWNRFYDSKNVNFGDQKESITAKKNAGDDSYVISNIFEAANYDAGRWDTLSFFYTKPKKGTVKVSYRVSDSTIATDADAGDWIDLQDPEITATKCSKDVKVAHYKIDRAAKYFQYKIQTVEDQSVRAVWFDVQPVNMVAVPTPTPTVTASAAPTADPSKGTLTVQTRKLVVSNKTNSTPSPSGPPLPNLTPTPKTTTSATPATEGGVNPICFDDQDTGPAPAVQLNIHQTSGGNAILEDQITDDEGSWYGLDGEIDQFSVGTYAVNFKEYQNSDYKLVALCVTPSNGEHHIKTQTTPTNGKATIIIKAGLETKVTALYAPRNKPYISMSKFAVNEKNKVIKSVVPGQGFRYVIRYENTGGVEAKGVTIQDVIPEQFFVPATEQDFIDQAAPFSTSIDARGRTIITKKLDSLVAGQKGSITIPVVLRSDAFGSRSDIENLINQQKETAQSPAASPSAQASAGTDGLQLQ